MVKFAKLLSVAAATLLHPQLGWGDLPLSLVSPPHVAIKPCQPVYVVLESEVDGPVDRNAIARISARISSALTIDGQSYVMPMPTGNSVAFVMVNESDRADGAILRPVLRATVILYWDIQENGCVFDAPGDYDVRFGTFARVAVAVKDSTDEERDIVAQIQSLGSPFAFCVLGYADCTRKDFASALPRLVEQAKGTAYENLLGVAWGLARLREVQPPGQGDPLPFLQKRHNTAKKYLGPFCGDPSTSATACVAAFHLGNEAIQLGQFLDTKDVHGADLHLTTGRALLERVSRSIYASKLGPRAANVLQESKPGRSGGS